VSQDRAVSNAPWATTGAAGAAPPPFTMPARLHVKDLVGVDRRPGRDAPGPAEKQAPTHAVNPNSGVPAPDDQRRIPVKHVKILGLAAVAAMALMAFVGASSASATVLCKVTPTGTNPATCPTAETYGAGTVIEGTAVDAKLTASGVGFPNVTCNHSVTSASISNTGSASTTVTGTITALDFTECETEGSHTPCEVEVENLPYHAEVHWTSGTHNGVLTVKSHGSGNPGAKVICSGVIECTFSKTLFELTVTGGNPAHVTAAQVPLSLTSLGLCPTSATWDATYVATNPTAIWVAKEEI